MLLCPVCEGGGCLLGPLGLERAATSTNVNLLAILGGQQLGGARQQVTRVGPCMQVRKKKRRASRGRGRRGRGGVGGVGGGAAEIT